MSKEKKANQAEPTRKTFANRELLFLSNVFASLLRRGALYPPKEAYELHKINKQLTSECEPIRSAISEYIQLEEERNGLIREYQRKPEAERNMQALNNGLIRINEDGKKTIEQAEAFLNEPYTGAFSAAISLDLISSGVVVDQDGKEKPLRLSLDQIAILEATILV